MSAAGLYARRVPGIDRPIQLGIAGGRVISVSFPAELPPDAEPDHPLFDRLEAYLAGEPTDFQDVTVALTVPTTHRQVLEALRTVPVGESVTVEQLTRMTPALDPESPEDQSVVESALRGNPAPLLIPDHRVRDGPHAAPTDVVETLRRVEDL